MEFLIADALTQGATLVLTAGAVQSNHARQTAAAAAKFGLKCHLILENGLDSKDPLYLQNGNALLDRLHGASIHQVPAGTDMDEALAQSVHDYAAQGIKAYSIPIGGSNPIGALGYVDCGLELADQMQAMDMSFDHLVMATGSAGTQAGLITGLKMAKLNLPVHGMCVSATSEMQEAKVRALTLGTQALLCLDTPLDKGAPRRFEWIR